MHSLLLFIYITLLTEILSDLLHESCPASMEFNNLGDFYKYKHDYKLKENEPLYRVWLNEAYNEHGAKCLDGSMAGFYYEAPSKASDTWTIFLQGGGACETQSDCNEVTHTFWGNSAFDFSDDGRFIIPSRSSNFRRHNRQPSNNRKISTID